MKKLFFGLLILPVLFLASCQEKEDKKGGITLPGETSISTEIEYSNDREGKGSYSITNFDPIESISWQSISTSKSTTTNEDDDGNLTLPTKAE